MAIPPISFFVDSVNGSDSNDGLTTDTAFATLATVQAALTSSKTHLALARGSYWREQFDVPIANCVITIYGTGAMPILDGADIVAATWTQPDNVTYPDVWSISWTRAVTPTTSFEFLGLWADGVRPRYASSLTDLQTNGGWFASNLLALTATVYIKSTADPNSSGIVYEITKRQHGINGHSTTLLATRAGQNFVGPIEIKRCVGHYNALSAGKGQQKLFFLRDGNIHHSVSESILTEDVVATEYSPQASPSVHVAYRDDGNGFDHTYRRCLILLGGGDDRLADAAASAIYGHSSSSPAIMGAMTIEQCISRGTTFSGPDAASQHVENCYVEDMYAIGVSASAIVNTFNRLQIRDTKAPPTTIGGRTGIRRLTGSNLPTLSVDNTTICTNGGGPVTIGNTYDAVLTRSAFVALNVASVINGVGGDMSTPIISKCIMQGGRQLTLLANGYIGDYNIFCFYLNGEVAPQIQWNGTVYGGTNMSLFQAASGQDLNSVFYKFADQVSGNGIAFWKGVADGVNNGPADGDWRINPNAKVYHGTTGAALTGVFADGVTPITEAGPQEYWDWNQRKVITGAPSKYPTLPASITEMRTYLDDPTAWDFYPA